MRLTGSLIIRGQRSLWDDLRVGRGVSGRVAAHQKPEGQTRGQRLSEGCRVPWARNYAPPYVLPYIICIEFSSNAQTRPWTLIRPRARTVYSIIPQLRDGIFRLSHEIDDNVL